MILVVASIYDAQGAVCTSRRPGVNSAIAVGIPDIPGLHHVYTIWNGLAVVIYRIERLSGNQRRHSLNGITFRIFLNAYHKRVFRDAT